MTIEEAKFRNEILEGLLATTAEMIKPYFINDKQKEDFQNCCHDLIANANNEIEYSINMDRLSKGLDWNEYNNYFQKGNYNQLAPQGQGTTIS